MFISLRIVFVFGTVTPSGPGRSNGKVLGFGLDGPGSIPGVGGVEIFLHSFGSTLVLEFTQPPIKMSTVAFPAAKTAELNVRITVGDNTGQHEGTHPIPGLVKGNIMAIYFP